MKSKFNSNDDLPLNKPLKFHVMTIIIRPVFEEGGKLYPKVFLDGTFYEMIFFEGNELYQKNACYVIIGIIKMLDLTLNHVFVTNVMMF